MTSDKEMIEAKLEALAAQSKVLSLNFKKRLVDLSELGQQLMYIRNLIDNIKMEIK